eukprot:g6024.t1
MFRRQVMQSLVQPVLTVGARPYYISAAIGKVDSVEKSKKLDTILREKGFFKALSKQPGFIGLERIYEEKTGKYSVWAKWASKEAMYQAGKDRKKELAEARENLRQNCGGVYFKQCVAHDLSKTYYTSSAIGKIDLEGSKKLDLYLRDKLGFYKALRDCPGFLGLTRMYNPEDQSYGITTKWNSRKDMLDAGRKKKKELDAARAAMREHCIGKNIWFKRGVGYSLSI